MCRSFVSWIPQNLAIGASSAQNSLSYGKFILNLYYSRFIALWLVDPHQRIISTANVPPQRLDWWLDATLGESDSQRTEAVSKMPAEIVEILKSQGYINEGTQYDNPVKLPVELRDMIKSYLGDGWASLLSRAEAEEHRTKLMGERSVCSDEQQKSIMSYNFCEH